MLFFTSDTHFGDHRTLNIHKRPFGSVQAMDEALVSAWNTVIGQADEVWHLGDFARKPADVPLLLQRLNGRKHLIIGNNDQSATIEDHGWASVQHYAEIMVHGAHLILCHYPFRSWNQQHRKSINLHGHSHGKLKPLLRQIDVGVDARDYRPVSLLEIAK